MELKLKGFHQLLRPWAGIQSLLPLSKIIQISLLKILLGSGFKNRRVLLLEHSILETT